jgi:ribonuclease HI
MKREKPEYHLYTDGSCYPNPGIGTYAYISIDESGNQIESSDWVRDTTNNRMETLAIIKGIESLPKGSRVVVWTDSLYAKNLVMFRGNVNKDLRVKLLDLMHQYEIEIKWVKGHSGNYYNDLADSLAYETLQKAYTILGMTGLSASRMK